MEMARSFVKSLAGALTSFVTSAETANTASVRTKKFWSARIRRKHFGAAVLTGLVPLTSLRVSLAIRAATVPMAFAHGVSNGLPELDRRGKLSSSHKLVSLGAARAADIVGFATANKPVAVVVLHVPLHGLRYARERATMASVGMEKLGGGTPGRRILCHSLQARCAGEDGHAWLDSGDRSLLVVGTVSIFGMPVNRTLQNIDELLSRCPPGYRMSARVADLFGNLARAPCP